MSSLFTSRVLWACLGCCLPLLAAADPVATSTSSRVSKNTIDARLELSHLLSADSETDQGLSYSDLRATLDTSAGDFEFHLDGRGRLSWNEGRDDSEEISRLFGQYNLGRKAWVALGRQTIGAAASARIDGAWAGYRFGDRVSAGLFGGLAPHPLTGDFNTDFATAGAAYEVRANGLHNQGGLVVQTFGSQMDRTYLSQRLFWQMGGGWSMFGFALVDLMAEQGILGDLQGKEPGQQSVMERVDLTNGRFMLRYRPSADGDVSVYLGHSHTILPSVWWRDWIQQQRVERGFVLDGDQPVGTRRSNVRVVGNLRFGRRLTVYGIGRYDRRHNDHRNGYEARSGLKVLFGDTGFADMFYSYRRYFVVTNHLAAARLGWDVFDALTLDAGAAAMYSLPDADTDNLLLYDLDAGLWLNLGRLSSSLEGLRLLVQYQAFIEPGIIYHIGQVRLAYRIGA